MRLRTASLILSCLLLGSVEAPPAMAGAMSKAAREAAEFSTLPCEEQPAAFFTLWTRKEALLKAIGEGIAQSLDRFEVTFLPGVPARVLSLPAYSGAGCEWSLVDLMISPSYAGALALPVRHASVLQFQFNPRD